jgi:GDP-4-dehydro-6-deoxy-D-mannose reductase
VKALVTGAEGFAGSHLAEYLLGQGQEVIALVLDRAQIGNLSRVLPQLRVEQADVADYERVVKVLQDTGPRRIYHLAAQSSPRHSFRDPKLTYSVNFLGTLNILCAWRQLELECRLLYVSSADVYGIVRETELPLREDAPFRPVSPYAGSKAAAELAAFQFFKAYGLPIVRVRPFNHTGPRQSPAFVCSSLARQIAEIELGHRRPTLTVGNLQVRRDFSDVRDIVRGYHLLLEKGEAGEVYQLCSGHAVSIERVVQILEDFASQRIHVDMDRTRAREKEPLALWGDPSKARKAVGWEPRYKLETTLHDLKLYWEETLRPKVAVTQ